MKAVVIILIAAAIFPADANLKVALALRGFLKEAGAEVIISQQFLLSVASLHTILKKEDLPWKNLL